MLRDRVRDTNLVQKGGFCIKFHDRVQVGEES